MNNKEKNKDTVDKDTVSSLNISDSFRKIPRLSVPSSSRTTRNYELDASRSTRSGRSKTSTNRNRINSIRKLKTERIDKKTFKDFFTLESKKLDVINSSYYTHYVESVSKNIKENIKIFLNSLIGALYINFNSCDKNIEKNKINVNELRDKLEKEKKRIFSINSFGNRKFTWKIKLIKKIEDILDSIEICNQDNTYKINLATPDKRNNDFIDIKNFVSFLLLQKENYLHFISKLEEQELDEEVKLSCGIESLDKEDLEEKLSEMRFYANVGENIEEENVKFYGFNLEKFFSTELGLTNLNFRHNLSFVLETKSSKKTFEERLNSSEVKIILLSENTKKMKEVVKKKFENILNDLDEKIKNLESKRKNLSSAIYIWCTILNEYNSEDIKDILYKSKLFLCESIRYISAYRGLVNTSYMKEINFLDKIYNNDVENISLYERISRNLESLEEFDRKMEIHILEEEPTLRNASENSDDSIVIIQPLIQTSLNINSYLRNDSYSINELIEYKEKGLKETFLSSSFSFIKSLFFFIFKK